MRVHHIGYLVKNLKKAETAFEALGYSACSEITYDELRDVNILFMTSGNTVVELVSPVSERSVVADLIKRYRNAPYHICYETEDIGTETERLREQGYVAVDAPAPAPAMDGRRVCFLMHACAGLIELVERERI